MLDPPPNGITTASSSRAALTTAATSSSPAGRTTTSGIRPRSPRRWRIRAVRLLPLPCTTRSRSVVENCSGPTASSRSALRRAGSAAAGISRSSKPMALVPGRRTSRPRTRSMKGASSGLPSWVKKTSSSPQPHHFIAAGVAPPRDIRGLDHSAAHDPGPAARSSIRSWAARSSSGRRGIVVPGDMASHQLGNTVPGPPCPGAGLRSYCTRSRALSLTASRRRPRRRDRLQVTERRAQTVAPP